MLRIRVFKFGQDPLTEQPHNYISRNRKARLIQRGAIELKDGSIQLPEALSPPMIVALKPRRIAYLDGCHGGIWYTGPSGLEVKINVHKMRALRNASDTANLPAVCV